MLNAPKRGARAQWKRLTIAELVMRDSRKRHWNWTSGESTVSIVLKRYSVYSIEGSQPLFVTVEAHYVLSWVGILSDYSQ